MTKPTNAKAAPKANAPKLAAISPETAAQFGKGMADAVANFARAQLTLAETVAKVAKLVGRPITASQYDKQLRPYVANALKAKAKRLKAPETRFTWHASRIKTATLALLCGDADLQRKAGETFSEYLERVSKPLETATLKDGRKVWDAQAKTGRPAGTKTRKPGTGAVGGPTGGHLPAADTADGGLDIRPALAAAMILAHGNQARAQRMVVIFGSYAEDFDRWAADILSDDDKAKLAKLTSVKTEDASSKGAARVDAPKPGTLLAAKFAEAAAKKATAKAA
jgi:hypothetical protein